LRRVYFAAVHKDDSSDFTALFPGVPGCITAGGTVEELEAMAREALQGHLDVSRDFGDPVPVPLTLDAVKAHEDAQGSEFVLAVAVEVESGKAARLNITMPEELVAEVDTYAKRRGLSRSAFLAKAARQAMHGRA
jgi:predicted RNase H-like HicB family nuclease